MAHPEATLIKADDQTPEESFASAVIPYQYDDNKGKYLRLRACGFGTRATLHLIGVAKSTLTLWREDSKFAELEQKIPEYRMQLRSEFADMQQWHNFALVLVTDGKVLEKNLDTPDKMTKREHDYLLKLRAYYTPQQMEAMRTIIAQKSDEGINWSEVVDQIRRLDTGVKVRAREITMEAGPGEMSKLQGPDEVDR